MTSSQGAVGEVERGQARDLLDEQWRAGRIEPGEHERRITLVRHAQTRADLDTALQGLPLPGRGGSSGPVIAAYQPRRTTGATAVEPPPSGDRQRSERTEGLIRIDRRTAHTVVSLTPFVCLLLFFGLDASWLVWFAIPIVPLVLYGKDGRDEADAERRALRHERKARRHQRVAQNHRRRRRR